MIMTDEDDDDDVVVLPHQENPHEELPEPFDEHSEPECKGTVLIIDDCPITCKASAKLLKSKHFEVVCAKTAKIGYDLGNIHRHKLVLILIDLIMPKVDGLECLTWFKDHPILSQIPTYILSCNHSSENEMIEMCLTAGASDLIGKPLSSDTLESILTSQTLEAVPVPIIVEHEVIETSNKKDSKKSGVLAGRATVVVNIPVRPRAILSSKKINRPSQIKYITNSNFNYSTLKFSEDPSSTAAPAGGTSASSRNSDSRGGSTRQSNKSEPLQEESSTYDDQDNNNSDVKATPLEANDSQNEEYVEPEKPSMHVLLINDSSLCSTMAAHQLSSAGYTLSVVSTCQLAYEMLCSNPFKYGIVMYDVVMPVNDGVVLLQLMREEQSILRDVMFIMLSGLQGDEYTHRCDSMGVTAVLKKPFSIEKFKHAVQPYQGYNY